MAARRRYTAKQKAAAVATATLSSVEAASESTGIPRRTIGYWMDKPEFAALRHKTRDAVADEFWTTIQVGLHRIADLIPQTDDLQKVSVATGILYDKHALLTGSATSRTESRDLTGSLSDGDISAAISAAEDLIGAGTGRAPETPEDPPAG